MKQRTIWSVLAVVLFVAFVLVGLATRGASAQGESTPSPDLDDVLELAQNFSGGNTDWEPFIQSFDGVEMVLVPAGCFMMGSTDEEIAAQVAVLGGSGLPENQGPQHEVCFDEPFWMDRTEVTNGQFTQFNGDAANDSYFEGDNRPREQITWDEASAYCESRGARLPTEAEWEYAAAGVESWTYPWGNTWNQALVIGFRDSSQGTADVGSLLVGASWVGALDMSGNVWEWVADWYDYYGTLADGTVNPLGPENSTDGRVLRGGSWISYLSDGFRASYRVRGDPSIRIYLYGFRCARSLSDTTAPISSSTPIPTSVEEALDRAANFSGTRNADWEPFIQSFDGVEMVLVPAGCFTMGSTDEEIAAQVAALGYDWPENQGPQHEVCFDEPFWMDRYEVTNGQFAQFNGAAADESYFVGANRPRESITWDEASAYCESRGARLPTEAEWEYAAAGVESWAYPWGNDWNQALVIGYRDSSQGTAYVGGLLRGASWVGALDMSGNVWEWVADWYDEDYYGMLADGTVNPLGPINSTDVRVLRGGSWGVTFSGNFRASYRNRGNPNLRNGSFGFRCARSLSDTTAPISSSTPRPTSVEEALDRAQAFSGTLNADWEPFIQEFDGVAMVLVPAGCFMMGSDTSLYYEAKPEHRVCFDEPFWIDKYEVTNAQFVQFDGEAATDSYFPGTNRPREQITWEEASAFCASRGARLPTEAEWEYAAAGVEGWAYPWGNEWNQARVIGFRNGSQGTADVGSLPDGASWVGALDLSGNVWEWVADWYSEAYYGTLADGAVDPAGPTRGIYRVSRGGSWLNYSSVYFRASSRYGNNPRNGYGDWGFRCARSRFGTTTPIASLTPIPITLETALEQAQTFSGTHNTDWEPFVQSFDGVEMVLVPAGCFMMGSDTSSYYEEKPEHRVCFDEPFWIDKYEVTNGQFARFAASPSESYFSGDNRPRESITWEEASAFCASRGARLPTEAEWEYAAVGVKSWVYPWGNEWEQARVVGFRDSSQGTADVGSLPDGASWVGALDMSGNVWEWVADWYSEDYYGTLADGAVDPTGPTGGTSRVLRGGSWCNSITDYFRASYRGWSDPLSWGSNWGFRCARSR